jgi:hypothetical protein
VLFKAVLVFLVGGGLLSKSWQPIAFAAVLVVAVWVWHRFKGLLLLGDRREN